VKKSLSIMLAVLIVLATAAVANAASPNFTVGGQSYTPFPQPVLEKGTLLVPVSAIVDMFDIDAKCNSTAQTILLSKNDKDVQLNLAANEIKVSGQAASLQGLIRIIGNRAYVPLRPVAEGLGGSVSWDKNTNTVSVTVPADTNTLTIFHAGSLKAPLADLKAKFQEMYPRARIYYESSGSLDCARKVTEQGRKADLIASADYSVFDQLMIPRYTDWYAMFARNEIVLCYTDKSKYSNEVNATNWYEVLLRPGVTYCHTNPDKDPAGYRALLVWQLAEKHYNVPGLYDRLVKGCPAEQVYDAAGDLIAALQAGKVDYAFEYLSVARQNNLRYVVLPEEVNLSSTKYADFYKNARVATVGTSPGTKVEQVGQPIVYAITIPNNAPNKVLALEFAKMMLGQDGQDIMTKAGQIPIVPAQFNDASKVPAGLK